MNAAAMIKTKEEGRSWIKNYKGLGGAAVTCCGRWISCYPKEKENSGWHKQTNSWKNGVWCMWKGTDSSILTKYVTTQTMTLPHRVFFLTLQNQVGGAFQTWPDAQGQIAFHYHALDGLKMMTLPLHISHLSLLIILNPLISSTFVGFLSSQRCFYFPKVIF